MRKIVIFGDSLIRPRPDLKPSERSEYEDTYAWKLKSAYHDMSVDIDWVESLDSEEALFWGERMVAYKRPDIVILQLGINDCVQRIFKKNSRSVLLRPWFRRWTRNLVMRLISRHRAFLLKYVSRNRQHVVLEQFEQNINHLNQLIWQYSPEAKIVFIGIASKPDWLEKRSPGDNALIKQYNICLEKLFGDRFVDPAVLGSPEEIMIGDGIHLKIEAHQKLFDILDEKLRRLLVQGRD